MSFRSAPVRLSRKAQQDFVDILRCTGETWGAPQLDIYRDKIDGALQAIGRNPDLGHRRQDLPETHMAYLVGSHIVVYRVDDRGVGILRILHQRMSLMSHLPTPRR